ncbi:MAG: DUF4136 domain-containing protein [Bacteroidota bacterium]
MNKHIALAVLLIAAGFFIQGCSSKINVSYAYDKEADFSKYQTYSFYGWAKGSEQVINRFTQESVENAVANELNARGLKYVQKGGDLTVSLFIQFDQKKGVTPYTEHYGAGPYGYRYGPGWGWGYGYTTTRYQEYDYVVGTLVIDIFDHQARELIWQGVGSKTVDENPNNREYGIKKAVNDIMHNYPVKPEKPNRPTSRG